MVVLDSRRCFSCRLLCRAVRATRSARWLPQARRVDSSGSEGHHRLLACSDDTARRRRYTPRVNPTLERLRSVSNAAALDAHRSAFGLPVKSVS